MLTRLTCGVQFQFKVGPGNFCCVHVSLVPVLGVVGEQKTKPTQHSVAVLRSLGLSPHLLACRSQEPLSDAVREKLVRCPPVLWLTCSDWAFGGRLCSFFNKHLMPPRLILSLTTFLSCLSPQPAEHRGPICLILSPLS